MDATLNYLSPVRRTFALVKKDNTRKINTFSVYALPPIPPVVDFRAADQVILRYVQALPEQDGGDAFNGNVNRIDH